MSKKFYITTSIMYTNAPPHVGFALELIQADVLARYHRQRDGDVFFLTGTDEHGTKNQRSAVAANLPPQAFVDDIAGQTKKLAASLHISNSDFIRTTDRTRHWPAVDKIWRRLAEKGDLYKKAYEGFYCVGHEAFIKKSELVDGACPIHKVTPERIEEENWFFRLTKYRDEVKKRIESGELLIVPETRRNEVLNLLDDAEDVSFSRPSKDLLWGVPVPDDPSQTIYVWADALTNYISALGYADDSGQFRKYWPADVHLIGKDILRFHAMIWPAMLLSAGLDLPKAIYVHGFITVDGQKMSKSLGNVIDPSLLLERYSADVVRYFLLREIPSIDDGDFSWKNLDARYTSDLSNGLGNLVQRVATLVETKLSGTVTEGVRGDALATVYDDAEFDRCIGQFRLHEALADIWQRIATVNAFLNERRPWERDIPEPDVRRALEEASGAILHIAYLLESFMPDTASRIAGVYGLTSTAERLGKGILQVAKPQPLFPKRAA